MKKDAVLLNTSRGSIAKEPELIQHLDSNKGIFNNNFFL